MEGSWGYLGHSLFVGSVLLVILLIFLWVQAYRSHKSKALSSMKIALLPRTITGALEI
jgi:hypothetical protein